MILILIFLKKNLLFNKIHLKNSKQKIKKIKLKNKNKKRIKNKIKIIIMD